MVPWTSPMMTELPPLLSNMGHSVFPVSLSDTAWGCRHGHPAGPENGGLLPLRQDRLSSHSSTSTWVPRLGHRSLSQPPWREAGLLPTRIAVRCLWGEPLSALRGAWGQACVCVWAGAVDVQLVTCQLKLAALWLRGRFGGSMVVSMTQQKHV